MPDAQVTYKKALKAIHNNEDHDYIIKLLQEVISEAPGSEFSQYAKAQINNLEYENSTEKNRNNDKQDNYISTMILQFVFFLIVLVFIAFIFVITNLEH